MGILSALSVPSLNEASIVSTGLQPQPTIHPQMPEVKGYGPTAIDHSLDTAPAEGAGIVLQARGGTWTRKQRGTQVIGTGSENLESYPDQIDAGVTSKRFSSWVKDALHDWFQARIGANYGEITSQADFGHRDALYTVGNEGLGFEGGSVANYPGPVPSAVRPTYNNLEAITWHQQILDQYDLNPQSYQDLQSNPTTYIPGGTASLGVPGVVLQ